MPGKPDDPHSSKGSAQQSLVSVTGIVGELSVYGECVLSARRRARCSCYEDRNPCPLCHFPGRGSEGSGGATTGGVRGKGYRTSPVVHQGCVSGQSYWLLWRDLVR